MVSDYPQSSEMIQVSNVYYSYKSRPALIDVSFKIKSGDITALVGPNGAGKSTLMRCLAGLDTPASGVINIMGYDVVDNPKSICGKIGYLSDSFGLYEDLSVRDSLLFIAGCHNLDAALTNARISEISDLLTLNDILDTKCGALSRGWRQRIGIAMSLLYKPDLLILDEPASGLDPESRFELSEIFRTLQSNGITLFVSSHILAELEQYCTSMLVIKNGSIVEHIAFTDHLENSKSVIEVRFSRPLSNLEIENLSQIFGTGIIPDNELSLSIEVNLADVSAEHILQQIVLEKIPVHSFVVKEKSLQSLYLELTRKNQ
jgi:ABC-2 type transport system ATP-binding protein